LTAEPSKGVMKLLITAIRRMALCMEVVTLFRGHGISVGHSLLKRLVTIWVSKADENS